MQPQTESLDRQRKGVFRSLFALSFTSFVTARSAVLYVLFTVGWLSVLSYACRLRNSTFDSLCDQEQCQDATAFRIPDEQRRLSFDDPRHKALQELSERSDARLAERQKAREEASARAEQLYDQRQSLQQEYRRAFDAAYGQGR